MTSSDLTPAGFFSRRNVILAGVVGVATAAVAACSSGSSSAPTTSAAAPGSSAGEVLATVASVPVGGAILQKANNTTYVVAQETAGNVICHLGICTHQGCPLTSIDGTNAVCPCHGSRFDVFAGTVEQGPATTPLPTVNVKVAGGNVVVG